MRNEFAALAVAALLSTGCAKKAAEPEASVPAAPATVVAPVAEAPPKPKSDEALAWMEGRWCGSDEDQQLEESWLMPKKDEAIGMSRTVSGGRMISFEFMRIANLEGSVTLIAQPGGDPPVKFARTDGGEGWIRFENKEHDYPQRIEYRAVGEGEGLHAEIGGPGAEGKEEVISYDYQRCAE